MCIFHTGKKLHFLFLFFVKRYDLIVQGLAIILCHYILNSLNYAQYQCRWYWWNRPAKSTVFNKLLFCTSNLFVFLHFLMCQKREKCAKNVLKNVQKTMDEDVFRTILETGWNIRTNHLFVIYMYFFLNKLVVELFRHTKKKN